MGQEYGGQEYFTLPKRSPTQRTRKQGLTNLRTSTKYTFAVVSGFNFATLYRLREPPDHQKAQSQITKLELVWI
jgi:hypothetical protein